MKALRDHLFEILLALVALCLLVLLVAPYWFGFKMQSSYEGFLEAFSAHSDFSYEVVSYDKGWFSTYADLLVKDSDKKPVFYFRHQIIPGPIYLGLLLEGRSPIVNLVINGEVAAAPESNYILAQLIGKNDQRIKVHATVNMNDDAVVKFDVPDISQSVQGSVYKINGTQLKLVYSSAAQQFHGELSLKDFQLQNKNVLEVSQLIFNFDQLVNDHGYKGDIVISLDTLKTKFKDQMVAFRQLSSRVKNEKKNNLMNLDIDINASTINAFNEQLNSVSLGVQLSSVYYDLLFKQIDQFLFGEIVLSDIDWHIFSALKIKPFGFYTEHGTYVSELQLDVRHNLPAADALDFYHRYETKLNMEVSDVLLKRIYEIITPSLDNAVNEVPVFLSKILQANYLEKYNNKFRLRLESKDDKYLINDLLIPYQDFERNLSQAVFSK